ncbi:hypothetical protein [Staphylococcus canis]|uniref:Uncharacterized protein n=1 Tax=Staphylococcus canis TaxID=2724942 RepID=A0ABS0T8W9_9STAP|nr:hypothetical protein [Staphylococcus canis]MBI5975189.1 hypothetical protein [Staphylococcus canis]HAR6121597.1 hypothetical protein [Staphylococcus pseudintermedius]
MTFKEQRNTLIDDIKKLREERDELIKVNKRLTDMIEDIEAFVDYKREVNPSNRAYISIRHGLDEILRK